MADGWVVGTMLDPTAPFIWEFLTDTPSAPSTVDPGLEVGLGNWSAIPVPMDNVTWHTHDGINLQRLCGSCSQPGKFLIVYTDTAGVGHFWNGSGWQLNTPVWFGGPGRYQVKIWDDGTNYKVDLINTATGNSVLPNIASIAKTSVRPFNLGRAVEVSEPFTNYYALDANLDNWIVRKYAASEPTITLGPATPTAVTISSFIGIAHLGSVQLDWETANEVELVGFNLYRAETLNGAKHKLNAVLIPH